MRIRDGKNFGCGIRDGNRKNSFVFSLTKLPKKKPDLAVSHEPDEGLVELVRMGEVVEQGLEQGAGHHLPYQAPAQLVHIQDNRWQ